MKNLFKKRNIIILIILFFITLSFGCSKTENMNEILIENTIKIEEIDHKYSNFQMTYKEYEEEISSLTGKISMDENHHRSYSSLPVEFKDYSKEEIEIYSKHYPDVTVDFEISGVYDYLDIKYIYTKSEIIPIGDHDKFDELIITKRYVYVLEDEEWILANIEKKLYDGYVPFEEMELIKFENEIVDYKERIHLLED
jgi:hypothetical protein